MLQSGRRRGSLSNSAIKSRLADPDSAFRIQMDALYKGEPHASKVLVYLIYEDHSLLANQPHKLSMFLCTMSPSKGSRAYRIRKSGYNAGTWSRTPLQNAGPLDAAACANSYEHHSESDH